MKDDCLFCKLANGVFPTNMVYENEHFSVIMDISPAAKGHCLVVTKEHYENALTAPDEILSEALVVATKVARGVKKAMGCDGVNILQNNGAAAGQTIYHLHLHVIPRWENDSIDLAPKPQQTEDDLAAVAKLISENM